MKLGIHTISALMLPMVTFAQDGLEPASDAVVYKEYSYAILGVSPGSSEEDATHTLSAYFDKALVAETVTMSITSSNGRSYQYEYAQRLVSPWVTPFVRMGSEPYEDVNVSLATGVLEGRVLGIDRTIVATGSDLPSAESVFRQVEEAFGTPSLVHLDTYKSELIYAYANGEFIADLKATDPGSSGAGVGSSDYLSNETPCKTAIGRSPINLDHQ